VRGAAGRLVFGAINGYLVGYMRMRAFLTTLVTFIIGRAVFDILVIDYGTAIQSSMMSSDAWDFIGDGTVFGCLRCGPDCDVIAVVAHIAITRSRPGWHISLSAARGARPLMPESRSSAPCYEPMSSRGCAVASPDS